MGWRFRRSFKVAPGLRLNLSRSGVSATVGVRGLHLTRGRLGTRFTAGFPGSGLSYSQTLGKPLAPPSSPRICPPAWLIIVILGLIAFMLLI